MSWKSFRDELLRCPRLTASFENDRATFATDRKVFGAAARTCTNLCLHRIYDSTGPRSTIHKNYDQKIMISSVFEYTRTVEQGCV